MKSQLINNYKDFIETLVLLKKRPFLFSLTLIIDFVFVFLFLMITRIFIDSITLHVARLRSQELFGMDLDIFYSINESLNLTLLYVLIIFALFLVLQNFNWFISNKILKNKIKYINFIKQFSLISLIYFVFISIIIYFTLRIAFHSYFENIFILQNISIFLIPLILILMLINLCTLNFKTTYKKIHYYIIPLIIIILLTFLVNLFSNFLFYVGIKGNLHLFITAILLFCLISISRIYLIKIRKK